MDNFESWAYNNPPGQMKLKPTKTFFTLEYSSGQGFTFLLEDIKKIAWLENKKVRIVFNDYSLIEFYSASFGLESYCLNYKAFLASLLRVLALSAPPSHKVNI